MTALRLDRVKVPHTLVLLFAMVVGAWVLTLVLPQGRFQRVTNEHGREPDHPSETVMHHTSPLVAVLRPAS